MSPLKTILPVLLASLCAVSTSAQNCDQVKDELAKVKAENEYLRASLKINKPVKMQTSDNIEFKLIKAEGNTKTQSITFTLVLTTSAANWYIMSSVKSIIDIDGNEYKLKSFTNGESTYSQRIDLSTGVPIKCTYTFGGVLPSVKMIKLFKYDYTHQAGEPYYAEFRDVSIDWH